MTPKPHARLVRHHGYEPDLPAEQIDALFHAALAQIKASASARAEAQPLRSAESSLTTIHPMPRWLKW